MGGTSPTAPADVEDSARSMWETFLDALPRVGVAVAVVAGGWVLSRCVRWLLRRAWVRSRTPSFAEVMSKVAGWMILTLVVLLAIAVTFPSVRPVDLLAGLGFFSVAIGFAFQDILENTLSGILLLFRQPFRGGDQIEVQGRLGTVEAITIRETRITTFDGQLVIIPNRDVYKNAIRVQTAYELRRLEFTVGVSYGSDLARATHEVVEAARRVESVAETPAPSALVSALLPSFIEIRVWFWSNPRQADAAATTSHVITAVKTALDEAGVVMPPDIVALQATPGFAEALRRQSP